MEDQDSMRKNHHCLVNEIEEFMVYDLSQNVNADFRTIGTFDL